MLTKLLRILYEAKENQTKGVCRINIYIRKLETEDN